MLQAYFRRHPAWPLVLEIARQAKSHGGRVLIVGGAVRDALLKAPVKDMDLEIYGLDREKVKRLLQREALNKSPLVKGGAGDFRHGRLQLLEIGKQFGVYHLGGLDIALPRTESRTAPGMGRKPEVKSRPGLDFEQASRRRDLTINALAWDPLSHKILDAHGGLRDLRRGTLKAVDRESFGDDPLRVLRVMQFAGRFGFRIHPDTVKLCRSISLKHLAKERVWEEWRKMLLKSLKPSVGLESGRDLGVVRRLHPALARLSDADWRATKRAVDRMATIVRCEKLADDRPETLLLASLIGRLSPMNAKTFLNQINASNSRKRSVMVLDDQMRRMSRHGLAKDDLNIRCSAFDLSKAGLTIVDLGRLAEASGIKGFRSILTRAKKLGVYDRPPVPLVRGSDMQRLGAAPGKAMGALLQRIFNEQLKGRFDDSRHIPQRERALKWARGEIGLIVDKK